MLPLTIDGATITGTPTKIQVDQGVRSLAIDSKDNVVLVVNESTGRIAEVSLDSGQVIGRIMAVLPEHNEGGDGDDDHSDHTQASNLPRITTISPATGQANTTITMTITGVNLQGATSISFFTPGVLSAFGDGHGKGSGGGDGQAILSFADSAFTVTNIQPSADGTQATATVAIGSTTPGARIVKVSTPNGGSIATPASTQLFVVTK